MIDFQKGLFDVSSKEDYFKGLQLVEEKTKNVVDWSTPDGQKILLLIKEVNLYATRNYSEVNSFLR
jgi:hypothetical protein